MSKVSISGNASGTGVFTIQAPNSNVDRVLSLPDEAGTVLTSAGVPASAMPAGSVIQVVSASTTTNTSTTSATYVAVTNLTASITPSSTSNKILILVNLNIYGSSINIEAAATIYKNGSDLTGGAGFADVYTGASDLIAQAPMIYLDSPATTSSTTYAVYFKRTQGSGTLQSSLRGTTNTITLMEIAA